MCQNAVGHPVDFSSGSVADRVDMWWRTMPRRDKRAFLLTWHLPPTVRLPLKEEGTTCTAFASCTHAPTEDWLWQQVWRPPLGLGRTHVTYLKGRYQKGFEGGSTSSGAEYCQEQELHSWLALPEGRLSDRLWKKSWWRTCEEKMEKNNQYIALNLDFNGCFSGWSKVCRMCSLLRLATTSSCRSELISSDAFFWRGK